MVKVFIGLYLLNILMDQVDTLHVDRYCSQVLCCTIMTHLDDLEVKVMDLEISVKVSCSCVTDFDRFSGKAQVR